MKAVMEVIMLIVLSVAVAGLLGFILLKHRRGPENDLLLMQQQLEAIRSQLRDTLDGNTKLLNQQLIDLTNQLQTQLHRQTGTLNDTRKAMDERLDNAARVIGDIKKSMGQVHEALGPVGEIRDILKAPKARGGFGEVLLEQLLEEMLPINMYSAQYSFADGERVDAIIKIGGQMVPIDSKFPLEKYQEYLKAKDDDERKTARKSISSALKKHITDVAKYIRPDEGTYPFAFMYIPSESIYYDLFIGVDADSNLWSHASSNRVFPVSSNTTYLYLQTISFGLKGMQIAEHARELLNKLEQLQKTLGDIRKGYAKIGTHLKNAQNAFDDTDKKFDKLENKFTAINTEAAPALAEPSKSDDVVSPPIN